MGSTYEIKIMLLQEFGHLISSKSIGNTPIILPPSLDISVRISPQQITQEALVRHIHRPLYGPYLIQALYLRRQPTMHAQYFILDDSGDR